MNVTFLIGNGFDINLGLDTRYSDFLIEYLKDDPADTEEIKKFKEDIRKREAEDRKTNNGAERLWSNAELAFGKYTDEVVKQGKTVETYFERYDDFCTHLATYLRKQEERVAIDGNEQDFIDAIQNFHVGLSEAQRDAVNIAESGIDGGYTFNFIVFNYTEIIDKITTGIKINKAKFGTRTIKSTAKANALGKVIHVHGTTTKDMIFGVNDETQISNAELFEGVSPLYINSIIKQKTNQGNEARIDEKTYELIKNSSCIYIYGMSLGDTDAIWWNRIIERMQTNSSVHVYIYGFDAPEDGLMQRKRWFYNANKKQQLLAYAKGNTAGLSDRIHIISTNIFEVFKNTALPLPEEDNKIVPSTDTLVG